MTDPGDRSRPEPRKRPSRPGQQEGDKRSKVARVARATALICVVAAMLTAPLWGREVLRRMDFFQVRDVEIVGAKYLTPSDIIGRLRVDTTDSVWDDPRPLEQRVAGHPQVSSVQIGRKLPGTLVVRITENLPIALVPFRDGLRPVDVEGKPLPIDPARANVDLPILTSADRGVLALLSRVRDAEPALYDRISEVRRVSPSELLVQLNTIPVRMMADVSPDRFSEVASVEQDLARRNVQVVELDFRFRDQVIARLQ